MNSIFYGADYNEITRCLNDADDVQLIDMVEQYFTQDFYRDMALTSLEPYFNGRKYIIDRIAKDVELSTLEEDGWI